MRRVRACPACDCDHAVERIRADEEQRNRFLQYSAVKYGGLMDQWLADVELVVCRCPRCGHHWYRDQPDERQLSAMYDAGVPFYGGEHVHRQPSARMSEELRRIARLFGERSDLRLLDYGSGHGRWARAAIAAGFQAWAYEPSSVRGKDETAPFATVHDLAGLAGQRFHVINVEQVLEHVPQPSNALQRVAEFCLAGAIVRITVPNILRAHERTRLWNEWPFNGVSVHTMAPFEHLHGFTPESLRALVKRAGFRPLPLTRLLPYFPEIPLRRIGGSIWKRLGQTFVLAETARG